MKKKITSVVVIIIMIACLFNFSGNAKSAVPKLNPLWQTEKLEHLEVLKIVGDEVYIRYKTPDSPEIEPGYGYSNDINVLDLKTGEFKWETPVTSASMFPNLASNYLQFYDDYIVTWLRKEAASG
ncbi:MAG: hypothetical protein R2883_04425 [Caldisericia bacterium]